MPFAPVAAPVRFLRHTVDTLASLVSGLGTGRDKAATTYYHLPVLSAGELVTMYRASWLARKIVTIPALDATRKWRAWQTDYPTIEAIEKEEKRLDVQRKVLAAKTKARLYGGAALYIGTGDLTPAMPLVPERIGKGGVRFLNVMAQSDLNPGDIEANPESPYYGTPGWYELRLRRSISGEVIRIHPSRLALFVGEPIPDAESVPATTTGTHWGTGDSVLMSVFEAIRQADSVVANVASLIFEAKVDVIRIPDLMANLTEPEFANRLLERFSLASTAKGINGTLLLDKEEEYEVKSPSLGNLSEVITRFLEIVSGAADIPVTRLLGQSPGGLNSTGEGDLRNYYDRVQAMQELEIGPAISILDECLIRSATGNRDESIYYAWSPLWQISEKERAEIGKIDADTVNVLNNTGLFPQEALGKAAVNLLTEHAILPGFDDEVEEAGGLPDYEAIAEEEANAAIERAQIAAANSKPPAPKAISNGAAA